MNTIETRRLASGADLIVERIPGVRSAGLSWLVPGGSAREPIDKMGLGAMWSELLFRGAGELDARRHADALDRLGVARDSDVQTFFMKISATMLGERVERALPLLSDMVLAPRFEEAAIDPVRNLCIQSLEALADDPHERVMLLARRMHLPDPVNRTGMGEIETLAAVTREDLIGRWREFARPGGSVIALAGAVDANAAEDCLNNLFSSWAGATPDLVVGPMGVRGMHHEMDATNQVHIAVVHDAPAESSEDSILERIVIAALSGGMSGRLFTEVREKRGLVYSVHASYSGGRDYGLVVAYAGTTPEKAQETLEVLLTELRRVSAEAPEAVIAASEFERAVVGMKSNLVMSGESTSARASALATDWFRVGRPRSLQEIADRIDGVTREEVNAYLARRDLGAITIASIGQKPLVLASCG